MKNNLRISIGHIKSLRWKSCDVWKGCYKAFIYYFPDSKNLEGVDLLFRSSFKLSKLFMGKRHFSVSLNGENITHMYDYNELKEMYSYIKKISKEYVIKIKKEKKERERIRVNKVLNKIKHACEERVIK